MQDLNPKVSIIIPIYNSENFLHRCLESALRQTYKNLEIICINDASTDNSLRIIENYARKDNRIKFYTHETNSGLGAARNTGIENSTGKYIAGIDSDDYAELNMIEIAVNAAEKNSSDIVCFGFNYFNNSGKLNSFTPINKNINLQSSDVDFFKITNPAFWNKLWKRELYTKNNILFPPFVYFQDLATTPRILFYASKLTILSNALYNYQIREGSATLSWGAKHLIDYLTVYDILWSFFKEKRTDYKFKQDYLNSVNQMLNFHLSSFNKINNYKNNLQANSYIKSLNLIKKLLFNYCK